MMPTSKSLTSRRTARLRRAHRALRRALASLKHDPEALALVCGVIDLLAKRARERRQVAA